MSVLKKIDTFLTEKSPDGVNGKVSMWEWGGGALGALMFVGIPTSFFALTMFALTTALVATVALPIAAGALMGVFSKDRGLAHGIEESKASVRSVFSKPYAFTKDLVCSVSFNKSAAPKVTEAKPVLAPKPAPAPMA